MKIRSKIAEWLIGNSLSESNLIRLCAHALDAKLKYRSEFDRDYFEDVLRKHTEKRINEISGDEIRTRVTNAMKDFNSEKFIDDIVERINRKQVR